MKRLTFLLLSLLPLFAMAQAPTSDSTKLTAPPVVNSFTPQFYYRGGNASNMQVGFYNSIAGKWGQLVTGYQWNTYVPASISSAYAKLSGGNNFTGLQTMEALGNNSYALRIYKNSTTIPIIDFAQGSGGSGQFLIRDNTGSLSFNINGDTGTILQGIWNGNVIGSGYGGAGSVNGMLKADGSGNVSAASGSDLPSGSGSYIQNKNGSTTPQASSKIIVTDSIRTAGIIKAANFTNAIAGDILNPLNPHNGEFGFVQGGGSYAGGHVNMRAVDVAMYNAVTDAPFNTAEYAIHASAGVGSTNTQSWGSRSAGVILAQQAIAGTGAIASSSSLQTSYLAQTTGGGYVESRKDIWITAPQGTGVTHYNASIAIEPTNATLGNTGVLIGTATVPSGNYGIYNASTYGNFLGTGGSTMGGGFINVAKGVYGALEFVPWQRIDSLKQATLTGPGYVKMVSGSPTYITSIPNGDLANPAVANLSGTNTGDQTTITGNAGTANALATSRTIGIVTGDATSAGSSFDGTANNTNSITVTKINGTSLASLATGLLKITTTTGVPSTAVSNTDYLPVASPVMTNPAADYYTSSTQISGAATPASGTILFGRGTGVNNAFAVRGSNGFTASFTTGSMTAARSFTLPDAAGTLALTTSNISGSAASLSAASTLPNNTLATTQSALDNSTKLATTAYSDAAITVSYTSTQTLTNKRITPRIGTTVSSSTPTPDGDNNDQYNVTALAANATFAAPTGTPTDGQSLLIRIKDNGTARTLAWNAIYRAGSDASLPNTTVISKTMYCNFKYNAADSKWDFVALTGGF